jgi:hypothetical protein
MDSRRIGNHYTADRIFGSVSHVISCVIAVAFLLIVLILVMPVRLGYKSWKLLKSHISDSDHRG